MMVALLIFIGAVSIYLSLITGTKKTRSKNYE